MSVIEPGIPTRICRRCGLPFTQYDARRWRGFTCRPCKNAQNNTYRKAKRKLPDRPPPERAGPSMPALRWLERPMHRDAS